MRIRSFCLSVSIAIALSSERLTAQSPGRAIRDALATLAQGFGGCYSVPDPSPFRTDLFPGVQFYRADCVREHGDPGRATVALDADSVLYLLGTPSGFQLLVRRHRPVVDSASALGYAFFAAEMAGALGGRPELVRELSDVPLEAYPRADSLYRQCEGGPSRVSRYDAGFRVCGLARTADRALYRWEAIVTPQGEVFILGKGRIFPFERRAGAG